MPLSIDKQQLKEKLKGKLPEQLTQKEKDELLLQIVRDLGYLEE
ncbi:hypothetical protein KKC1_06000 [Calderihabitans maritimus]|uniref:Uncharacterized protein n=1 Tax=Calderihabitans maritimus TaxID=1246530 RepID=A0A1Z5HPS1_9FIRM|nr:hypothetical protein KKC1_06000 [Calderihabitans maritimus]